MRINDFCGSLIRICSEREKAEKEKAYTTNPTIQINLNINLPTDTRKEKIIPISFK